MDPDAVELRVIGCLLEKQRTTPDGYPLTLNALRLACNQATNRDPVVEYDEETIRGAVARLRRRDWIEITARGTAIIYGRSDSTINRSGVRMGTAEIYRAVAAVDEIVDALVVDIPRPGTEGWMPLFVVLAEGAELDDDLVAELRRRIREGCSPRHVPNEVHAIAEVPRTLSGKILEVPVKKILMGTPPEQAASRESLANPDALEPFVKMARHGS